MTDRPAPPTGDEHVEASAELRRLREGCPALEAAERILAARFPADLSHRDAHIVARALIAAAKDAEEHK